MFEVKSVSRLCQALSAAIAGVILTGIIAPRTHAQAQFDCTGDIYQVQSGQLRIFDPINSVYTNIGPSNPSYNSLAFNLSDRLLYATRNNSVVRIDANGTLTTLFSIGFNSFIGDMDENNNLYLRRNSDEMVQVNVVTQTITNIPLSTTLSAGAADWAFVDTPQGPRLIAPGRAELSLIDTNTGQNSTAPIANYPDEGSTGAVWADSAGRVFVFRNNTGNVYEIFDYLTANPRARLVAVGTPSGNNDGTSCRLEPFPNLSPVAFNDAFLTPFETALSGVNVIADNGNGEDNDPDGTPVTINDPLIDSPSNGSVTINDAGDFEYTPDPGFSGVDQFTYEIVDGSGLTAQAVVTITVTRPNIGVTKISSLHSESAQGDVRVSGNDVVYSIVVSNSGNQAVDADTLFVVDTWPADLAFRTGDIDSDGSSSFADTDPVVWQDNASGLTFDFARDVRFSSGSSRPTSLADCTHTLSGGYDTNVRYVCIRPLGAFSAGGQARFFMRGRIE